jgi:hypothetical protein
VRTDEDQAAMRLHGMVVEGTLIGCQRGRWINMLSASDLVVVGSRRAEARSRAWSILPSRCHLGPGHHLGSAFSQPTV